MEGNKFRLWEKLEWKEEMKLAKRKAGRKKKKR
jgi:hypothetical protein